MCRFHVPAVVRFVAGVALAAWVMTVTTGAAGAKLGARPHRARAPKRLARRGCPGAAPRREIPR